MANGFGGVIWNPLAHPRIDTYGIYNTGTIEAIGTQTHLP